VGLEDVLLEPKEMLNACAELGARTEEMIATPAASKEQPTKVEKVLFISVKSLVELDNLFCKALLIF
jgi:hypothetical protein